jgi:uncharacterized damage-inducible protein DinB
MSNTVAGPVRRAFVAGCTFATLAVMPTLASAQADAGVAGLEGARRMHEMVRDLVMATATDTPADLYGYQPTDEVRTLGQILGHIGNASFMFCSTVLGDDSPAQGNLEEAESKDALVAGLTSAFEYCDRAYSEPSPADLTASVDLFGMGGTKMWVLIFNATHNWEHYGNLVTYMRLNDIVPPSSRGGM